MSRRRRGKGAHRGERRSPKGGRLLFGWPLSRRRTAASLAAIALVAVALVVGLLFHNLLSGGGPSRVLRAAIVDQVGVYDANPEFIAAATDLLEGARYAVDYYPSEEVTVDFYRNLPTQGYDVIVLRVHSGITIEVDAATGDKRKTDYVSLFTAEPYSETKYSQDQIGRPVARLGRAPLYEGGAALFTIGPEFIERSMPGGFDKTLIIMMGCDGLRSEGTAQAFLDKGASAFVSWTDAITWGHSDAATERMLELLLVEGLTTEQAVVQTAAELGPDPVFGAELRVLIAGG